MNSKHAWICVAALSVGCADLERGPELVEDEEPVNGGGGDDNGGGDDGGDEEALSFVSDGIYQTLRDGCEAACHVSGGSAASTGYIIVDDPDADYMNTLMFINESNPGTSRLLTKGAGQSHGGGSIYGTDSEEFALILNWIQDGALP